MNKPTDFSKYLSDFLVKYLPHERGVSINTLTSYRDSFVLFFRFMQEQKNIKAEKITLQTLTKDVIVEFLDWIQSVRKCGNATRNQRLAAIHSFCKYLQYQHPESIHEIQRILSIKLKRNHKPHINHLSVDGIKLLLEQPDPSTKKGIRDLTLISLMYDAGARVQEVIDLTPSCFHFDNKDASTVIIKGKGSKTRVVPLSKSLVNILQRYLTEYSLKESYVAEYPLFSNSRREKFTRVGITEILQKYAKTAHLVSSNLVSEKITPHSLRHSKAMALVKAGVNLVYIRDFLGHSSITTTEIYARADSEQKRKAIESAYADVLPKEEACWIGNKSLIDFLNGYKTETGF